MQGLALASCAVVCYGLGIFMAGRAAYAAPPALVFLLAQTTGALALLVLIPLLRVHIRTSDLEWGLLAGTLATVGTLANIHALSSGQMTVVAPLVGLSRVATAFLLSVLSGHIGRPIALPALGLGAVSVLLIRQRPQTALAHKPNQLTLRGYLPNLLAILAGITIALQFNVLRLTITKIGLDTLLVLHLTSMGMLAPLVRIPQYLVPNKKYMAASLMVIGSGLALLLADIASVAALHIGNLLAVSVTLSFTPAVVVILAWSLTEEKPTGRQVIGIITAIATITLFVVAQ